jgi:magnesium transporter
MQPADPTALGEGWLWLDLLCPTSAEEDAVEAVLGLDLPTAEDMRDIELSNRLYREDGATFLTVNALYKSTSDDPDTVPVTLVLKGQQLITVRYHDPSSVQQVIGSLTKIQAKTGADILLALFETMVARSADALERAGDDIKVVRRSIFNARTRSAKAPVTHAVLQHAITRVGQVENLISKVRDSLVSLGRAAGFCGGIADAERLRTLTLDIQALNDQAVYMQSEATFVLDAALGLITVQQNAIVKIFSVAAVVFLPPTLVASIYGMNFTHMPELAQPWGYPMALVAMVASAVLPFLYFKHKGWL